MKKRLVIAGLPCPAETWKKFLGSAENQRIITMHEILSHSESSDPRELSRYITKQIAFEKPTSIVAHDMGVPLTLLALLRLRRMGIQVDAKLTLFNGPFRGVSLWKARQPLKIQWTSANRMARDVEKHGGQIDSRLIDRISEIRSMYRAVIRYRIAEKMTSLLGMGYSGGFPKNGVKLRTQIIASRNDPYLPFETMEQLREDLQPERFVELEYGHFPYSVPSEKILSLLQTFEN